MDYKEQMEDFLANLLDLGFKGEHLSLRGYEYALALLEGDEGGDRASSMALAVQMVRTALPGGHRRYELRHRSW